MSSKALKILIGTATEGIRDRLLLLLNTLSDDKNSCFNEFNLTTVKNDLELFSSVPSKIQDLYFLDNSIINAGNTRDFISKFITIPYASLILLSEDIPSIHFSEIAESLNIKIATLDQISSREIEVRLRTINDIKRALPITSKSLVGVTEISFQNVVESLHEGVSWCDADGHLVYANPSLERITGFKWAEIKGRRIYECFLPVDSSLLHQAKNQQHRRYLDRLHGLSEVYETEITHRDGNKRWIEVKASPLCDSNGVIAGSIGVVTDITERKSMEAQLQWSQKMEAVGRLAGGVAHDFNNLLTVISGYSLLLIRQLETSTQIHKFARAIHQASEAAQTLTQQLLTLSKRQVIQTEILMINDVINNNFEIIKGLIGDKVDLQLKLDGELSPIKADPGQLLQVIINLVINAFDAMPDGGAISIGTSNVEISAKRYTSVPQQLEQGKYVILRISDSGYGMTSKVKAHLFEPFFTTKKNGTGLGLSTVYSIVNQHHGGITVESELNQGTKFNIYFPASYSQLPIIKSKKVELSPVGIETILLVEDQDSVRGLLSEVLSTSGYTVIEAALGHSALEILAANNQSISLVLTDIVMTDISGFEIVEFVMSKYPKIKVLVMSGYTDDSTISEQINKRRIPFLAKPFSPDILTRRLREVLDSEPID